MTAVADLPLIQHWDLVLRLRCEWCGEPATIANFYQRQTPAGSLFPYPSFRCDAHKFPTVEPPSEAFRL